MKDDRVTNAPPSTDIKPLKTGALFAGYGGLEIGISQVLHTEPAWLAEFDAAPSRILAQRFPDVPNLGDVTKVDWAAVEPVDIITGGSPCQDLSGAGKRAGMKAGTRSGLWASMCEAIEIIRPRLVVWENVRGALSAPADSGDLESCEFCVDGDGEPSLRALGRVLGDLAELGYDAAWTGLRAADVGAPHGRFRVFILAWPAEDADRAARGERGFPAPGQEEGGRPRADAGRRGGAPAAEALSLLPTPTSTDHKASGASYAATDTHHTGTTLTDATVRQADRFGQYAPAIARWEAVLGRPAPAPTEATGKGGAHRLSPRFVEWLMGLPDGWVTDTDTTRNEQLKALGNGVVPQQAAAAVRHLLGVREWALTRTAA